MINNWKNISLLIDAPIKEAMQKLNDSGLRVTFVVDPGDHLLATVTDGDIRRGLLSGLDLDAPVSLVMKSNPISISRDATKDSVHDVLRNASVLAVPVVDDNRKIIGLETIDSVEDDAYIETPVVLMAGGFGKRLHPLTNDLPKPMLPLGKKPILEHIMEDFKSQGFRNFYITTHYKADIIKDYFIKNNLGLNIEFIFEEEPLGTAGSLCFLKEKLDSNFFVMNADLLVKTNFRNLLSFHEMHNEIATMCVKQHTYQVPYGVVFLDNMNVKNIVEKPSYSHFVSSGIYCFNNSVFDFFDKKEYMDMPSLLKKLLDNAEHVKPFLIHESWLDIGRLNDYQKASEDF